MVKRIKKSDANHFVEDDILARKGLEKKAYEKGYKKGYEEGKEFMKKKIFKLLDK